MVGRAAVACAAGRDDSVSLSPQLRLRSLASWVGAQAPREPPNLLPVNLGAFMMPSHPPERPLLDGIAWDLAQLRRLDALGFTEAWIGEHFTAPWEPCPAPDLLIAQALLSTERIKLSPGAHLLPYHHPMELAHRVAYLDHLARGRYMLGVGISALPSDLNLFAMDAAGGENRRRTLEALDVMLRSGRASVRVPR